MQPAPASSSRRFLLYAVLGLLAVLRIDLWLWDDPARALGLPVGMIYHVVYCLVAAGFFWILVRHAWPEHLTLDDEDGGERTESVE